MCDRAEWVIARKAIQAALAESDLVEAINAEARFHKGVVAGAREMLVARGDRMAVEMLDGVTGRQPDMEQARAMVEG